MHLQVAALSSNVIAEAAASGCPHCPSLVMSLQAQQQVAALSSNVIAGAAASGCHQ